MPFRSFLIDKADGMAGVVQTIQYIDRIAQDGAIKIRPKAVALAIGKPDDIMRAAAVFKYLHSSFAYIRDIFGVETLHSIPVLMQLKYGDCDDFTIVSSAFLQAVGFPVRYVVAGVGSPVPNHVYLEFLDRKSGRYVPFDLTQEKMGVEANGILCRKIYRIARV
jgi:transglutaminase-like putative cysteine protease